MPIRKVRWRPVWVSNSKFIRVLFLPIAFLSYRHLSSICRVRIGMQLTWGRNGPKTGMVLERQDPKTTRCRRCRESCILVRRTIHRSSQAKRERLPLLRFRFRSINFAYPRPRWSNLSRTAGHGQRAARTIFKAGVFRHRARRAKTESGFLWVPVITVGAQHHHQLGQRSSRRCNRWLESYRRCCQQSP